MGRPARKGLDYFNLDCDQEDNLNFLEAKHGIVGYGVIVKLWKKIYQLNGYYCDWTEKNIYLFAKEVNVPVDKVREVVATCFEEQLFDKEIFNRFQVLTSRGIQRRWKKIVTEAKRKETEIDSLFRLLPSAEEEPSFTPEKTVETPDETPQRKAKKKKQTYSMPALQEGVDVGNMAEKTQGWSSFVKVWFDFVELKFGTSPLFAGEDPRLLKSIVLKLERRVKEKKREWNGANGAVVLRNFLEAAYQDTWLAQHFLLRNLDSKFEQIERLPIQLGNGSKADSKGIANDIQQLYERFLTGKGRWETYDPSYFEWLQKEQNLILSKQQQAALRQETLLIRTNQLFGSNHAQDLRALEQYQKSPPEFPTEDTAAFDRIFCKRALLHLFTTAKDSGRANAFQPAP